MSSSEDPNTSLVATAKLPAMRQRRRAIARVFGIAILLISLLPFTATVFLLNQELQLVPLQFELVGFGGPVWFGSTETELSLRLLLVVLGCITCAAWGTGACLAFESPWRWFTNRIRSDRSRGVQGVTCRSHNEHAAPTCGMNPYSPPTSGSASESAQPIVIAIVGLSFAIAASIALLLAGEHTAFVSGTFMAIPALLISLVALRHRPRGVAICGVLLATLVCLFLPTMIVAARSRAANASQQSHG